MFTGIIEELGTVNSIRRVSTTAAVVTIDAEKVLDGVAIGDSIAVNGICLTVTTFTATSFMADVMPETINRTSLADLRAGCKVNLERALPVTGRFGGHIVTGHIDGTGVISSIRRDANAVRFFVRADKKILQGIVEKGSVALDGISLTIAQVTATEFCVSVIPHTLTVTNLGSRKIGDSINIENDCIGKYIRRQMEVSSDGKNLYC